MKTIEDRIRQAVADKITVQITARKRAGRFVVNVPFHDDKVIETPSTWRTKREALIALLVAVKCSPRLRWTLKPINEKGAR